MSIIWHGFPTKPSNSSLKVARKDWLGQHHGRTTIILILDVLQEKKKRVKTTIIHASCAIKMPIPKLPQYSRELAQNMRCVKISSRKIQPSRLIIRLSGSPRSKKIIISFTCHYTYGVLVKLKIRHMGCLRYIP